MSRSRLPLLALSLGALLAGAAGPAGAEILSISTLPPQPTTHDEVTLVIEGRLSDGCWKADFACPELKVTATDAWEEGLSCLLMLVPYEFTCDLGRLPSGNHMVEICEERLSKREPGSTCLLYGFSIQPAEQADQGRTWGALKAIYR